MVQVEASFSYHNPVDENPEPSLTNVIREAVSNFVESINDSSRQLASAAEHFAVESLHTIDEATQRAEQSASTTGELAETARKAADEARDTVAGLTGVVAEAAERMRQESARSADLASGQTLQIQELGDRVNKEIALRVDEMVARIEQSAGSTEEGIAAARAATTEAVHAAERVQKSVDAVEIAVTSAQRAADEAREAASRTEASSAVVAVAVTAAQAAAETSREAALLAEQAGSTSSFAAEANTLLERLEGDYALLIRLVQELHLRIASLSSVSVAEPAQAPANDSTASESPDEPVTTAAGPADTWKGDAGWPSVEGREVEDSADTSAPEYENPQASAAAFEALKADSESQPRGGWQESATAEPAWTSYEATAAEAASAEIPIPQPSNDWTATPPEAAAPYEEPKFETLPSGETQWQQESKAPTHAYEGSWEIAAPPATTPAEEPVTSLPAVTIFGRVQLTIAPVMDFDRLLSLDGALARVDGIQSVTLADYALEAVTFRIELQNPMSVHDFARSLGEAAGVRAEVSEASESTLSIRIS